MDAAIVAVGSELLGPERLDTNSLKLTRCLERHGVALAEKVVVGDDEEAIAGALRRLAPAVDLVLVGGGLGPTADDCTRAAAARAFGREVAVDESLVEDLRARFAAFGRDMPEVNRRQAEVIAGAAVLPNPYGTAPGMRLEEGGATIFLFPGVPRELEGMIERYLEPWLAARQGDAGNAVERRTFKIAGRAESDVEGRLAPLYERFGRRPIAVLASPGEVRVVLTARGPKSERRQLLEAMSAELRALLGRAIFTDREDGTLEEVVIDLLRAAGRTLVTAESCTGGMVAERLTRVPGASDVFLGGVVSYANRLKRRLLGVDAALLERHGAVSEPVARAMARGARERLGGDFAIAITGIAGPGGGSEEKPVGTVHVVVEGDGDAVHRRVRLPGDRQRIRRLTTQMALELLRRALAGRGAAAAEGGT